MRRQRKSRDWRVHGVWWGSETYGSRYDRDSRTRTPLVLECHWCGDGGYRLRPQCAGSTLTTITLTGPLEQFVRFRTRVGVSEVIQTPLWVFTLKVTLRRHKPWGAVA